MNTVDIGDLGEIVAIMKFTKAGCVVSKPLSNNARYDLVVDYNNKLYKIQVKTTTKIQENMSMTFATKTTNYTKGSWASNQYTKDDIDGFFLYCSENEWCGLYFGDEDGTFKQSLTIRLKPSKSGQVKNIRMADQYEFNHQLNLLS